MFTRAYTFTDLFDSTFKVLKHTWKNTLIVTSLAFMPISFFYVLILNQYFKVFSQLIENGYRRPDMELLNSFIPFLLVFIVAMLVIAILQILVRGIVTVNAFRVIREEQTDLKSLVFSFLREKAGKLLLQTLLCGAVIFAASVGAGIVIILITAVLIPVNNALALFIMTLFLIAFFGFLVWLSVSFNFISEELLFSDVPVTTSLINSIKLVKGNWWRVLGISFVISLALSFAINMVTSPFSFALMAPSLNKMMELVVSQGSDYDVLKEVSELFTSIQFPIFLSIYISSILTMMFEPVFNALFYIDLKFRKNLLPIESEIPEQPQAADPFNTDWQASENPAEESDKQPKNDEDNNV